MPPNQDLDDSMLLGHELTKKHLIDQHSILEMNQI
ncbi:hypothetical protein LCGC14_0590550 [marine sediment metagenome]|uniref:Uncharacterized protein n=1 Tax=marine sediment metagenome TaxID=412755 RepID=A0A0F9RXH3_9ZZZZ